MKTIQEMVDERTAGAGRSTWLRLNALMDVLEELRTTPTATAASSAPTAALPDHFAWLAESDFKIWPCPVWASDRERAGRITNDALEAIQFTTRQDCADWCALHTGHGWKPTEHGFMTVIVPSKDAIEIELRTDRVLPRDRQPADRVAPLEGKPMSTEVAVNPKALHIAGSLVQWLENSAHNLHPDFAHLIREAAGMLVGTPDEVPVPLRWDSEPFTHVGQRVSAWRKKNFDDQDPMRNLVQITEELGELARAVGKEHEGIRPDTRGNISDETGDVLLATLGFAFYAGVQIEDAVSRRLARMEALDFKRDPEGGKKGP